MAAREESTRMSPDGIDETSSQALTLLAGVGLGAALMYLLDPSDGARRRALIRDQAMSSLRTGRREVSGAAQDAKNRALGASAELRNRLRDEDVTDEQLVARVRAELGHHVERARAIEVVADHGKVILRGQASPDELDDVVTTVRRVQGVEQVENQLRVTAL